MRRGYQGSSNEMCDIFYTTMYNGKWGKLYDWQRFTRHCKHFLFVRFHDSLQKILFYCIVLFQLQCLFEKNIWRLLFLSFMQSTKMSWFWSDGARCARDNSLLLSFSLNILTNIIYIVWHTVILWLFCFLTEYLWIR